MNGQAQFQLRGPHDAIADLRTRLLDEGSDDVKVKEIVVGAEPCTVIAVVASVLSVSNILYQWSKDYYAPQERQTAGEHPKVVVQFPDGSKIELTEANLSSIRETLRKTVRAGGTDS